MNKKLWLWSAIAAFAVIFGLEYLFYGLFMKDMYVATAALWRPDAELMKLMPLMWFGYLVVAFFMPYIYAKGYESKPSRALEGIRFGFVLGLFVYLPMSLTTYVTMPIPFSLSVGWFVSGLAEFTAAGLVMGLIYKK